MQNIYLFLSVKCEAVHSCSCVHFLIVPVTLRNVIQKYCYTSCSLSRNFYAESESKGATVDHSDCKNIEGI